jgi:hypothetical protein
VEIFEELDEDVLNEVLWGHASREVIRNDAVDLGVEGVDEPSCGGFVSGGFPCSEGVLEGRKHGGEGYGVDTPRSALGNTGCCKFWGVGGDLGVCLVLCGMPRATAPRCV